VRALTGSGRGQSGHGDAFWKSPYHETSVGCQSLCGNERALDQGPGMPMQPECLRVADRQMTGIEDARQSRVGGQESP